MRHDPKKLEAHYAAWRKKCDSITKPFDARIEEIKAERDKAVKEWRAKGASSTFADGLLFAATNRCQCGKGLCYKEGDGDATENCWVCIEAYKANLKGSQSFPYKEHTCLPFFMYEVKSETQPSADGATTRDEPVEINAVPE